MLAAWGIYWRNVACGAGNVECGSELMKFFGKQHCESKAHCLICRNRVGGAAWRKSIVDAFTDVEDVDFDCPKGIVWDAIIPVKDFSRVETSHPEPETTLRPWGHVREAIVEHSSDSGGRWDSLKDLLQTTEKHVKLLGERQSPCWRSRQLRRVREAYAVVVANEEGA